MTIAAVGLIGLWTGLPLLSRWSAGFPPMAPRGALGIAALGLALMHPGKNARVALAVGIAAIALAVFHLILLPFNVEPGILDRWLAPQAHLPKPSFQVESAAAVVFGLVGGSLALSCLRRHLAASVLGGLAGIIAMFALLGYLAGIDTLYGSVSVNSPPLPTVVCFLCIAGGIILRIGAIPAPRTSRPLRHLLIMLGGAIAAPLLLFGAYAGARIADAQLRQVQNELVSEARILSANVDREIVGEIEILLALRASPSLHRGDFATFQRQAEAALALRQSGEIMLVDRNMRQIVNTRVPFGTSLPRLPVQKYVERALATGEPQVTDLFTEPVTKQPIFGVIVPVQIDGENRYALIRAPNPQAIARVIAANELPRGQLAVVSDAARRIIVRSEQDDRFIGKELPPSQLHRPESRGVFEFVDSSGRPSLEAYTQSKVTGWETAVSAPKAVLNASIWTLWRILGLTALLALVLVVGLASWLGRIIAGSVGYAARAAIASGEGALPPLRGTSVAEVDMLMAEFQRTATRRQAAERLLRESKDRLELALNAAQLGLWQYDPSRSIVLWDKRTQEIVDIPRDETVIEELLMRVHPDDRERFWAGRKAALDPADPKPYASEYRILRRDGKVRWVESRGLAYFEGAGPGRRVVGFVGTIKDVTERAEREEKEHLLMREINHRAKNMLSVVDSIAHQTATRNPEDFVERFSERIQALSANQDLLVRNEWQGVDAEDLVRAQLAHFTDLIGSRIAVHGPKLRLNPASAQAIGLALHELATNAGKYGALSTDGGHVDVRWGTDGGAFTMSWTERDGPPVIPPRRPGFGTVVVKAMAERSVAGTVDLDYAPTGVKWRLTCPAVNVLEFGGRGQAPGEERSAAARRVTKRLRSMGRGFPA